MNFTHFSFKGLVKVRTEWSLVTLAYNLKRAFAVPKRTSSPRRWMLNQVSLAKLMAAVA